MDFDKLAKTWDTKRRSERALKVSEEIIKAIPKELQKKALEFGAGTGLVSFNIREHFEEITLVDLSEGMVAQLNHKIKSLNAKNMQALSLDINENSDLLGTYDVIYTSMVLHHIIDIKSALSKLYQLLNENGILCLVDLDKEDGSFHAAESNFQGHHGFEQEDLQVLLSELGFKSLSSHSFYEGVKRQKDKEIDYSLFIMTGRK